MSRDREKARQAFRKQQYARDLVKNQQENLEQQAKLIYYCDPETGLTIERNDEVSDEIIKWCEENNEELGETLKVYKKYHERNHL